MVGLEADRHEVMFTHDVEAGTTAKLHLVIVAEPGPKCKEF